MRRYRRGLGSITSQPPGPRVSLASLGSITSQPPGPRVFRFALGDDITTPTLTDPLARVEANTVELLRQQKIEQDQRKLALIITGAGALFALARLGVVTIPLIRRR